MAASLKRRPKEESMRLMRFKDTRRCPDAMELAEWLDGGGSAACGRETARLDAVADHLSRCAECRRSAIELRRVLASPDTPLDHPLGKALALACASRLRPAPRREKTAAVLAALP